MKHLLNVLLISQICLALGCQKPGSGSRVAGTYSGELHHYQHIYIGTFPDSNGVDRDLYDSVDTTYTCEILLESDQGIISGSGCEFKDFDFEYDASADLFEPFDRAPHWPVDKDHFRVIFTGEDSLVIDEQFIAPEYDLVIRFEGKKM